MADRRSYKAFLREIKRQYGLTHAQARVTWHTMRERLERTPRAADLRRHPRIAAEEAKRAPRREAAKGWITRRRHMREKAQAVERRKKARKREFRVFSG